MVIRKKKVLSAVAAGVAVLTLAGSGDAALPEGCAAVSPKICAQAAETDNSLRVVHAGIGDGAGADVGGSGDDQDNAAESVMHGPDVPPAGMRYDEWKGFQYSTDTSFDARTFWTITMYDGSVPSSHGLNRDPEHIEDAVLQIVDAKAEPVGGEMKLRSGGFVDITIELYWTGTMRGTETEDIYYSYSSDPWYVQWTENAAYPCDAYTGTSLLNYIGADEETDDTSIGPGQATASSMAESDITWEGRTYRLFAKSDIRNASFSEWNEVPDGDIYRFSVPCALETTLSFRVPADYDGLVLAIDKDITDERDTYITENGEFISFSDMYADVLTTSTGTKQSADDFYFVRVSDLLEHFRAQ